MATNTHLTMKRPDRRAAFTLLFVALVAVGAGNTMLITSVLPLLSRDLGLPDWTVGAIFSLSAVAWVLFSPIWGKTSNTWGRRRVAALGMFGFGTSMLLFGTVGTVALMGLLVGWPLIFAALLSSRTLFGVFGSGTNPAAQAYIADRTTEEERTGEIATLTAGFSVGTVIGPTAAAVMIVYMGLLAPVFVISAIAFIIGIAIWIYLPETQAPRAKKVTVREAKGLWRSPGVAPYLIYGVGLSLVSGILAQTFPFAMIDKMQLGRDEAAQLLGPVMTFGAMATLVAQLLLVPRLRLSSRNLMVWGAAALGIGSFLMIWADMFAVLALIQMLFGLGQGFSRPGFTGGASLAVSPELQGNVAGLVTAVNGMGFVVSPLFGLWAYQNIHPSAPFWTCTVVLALMAAYAFFMASPSPPDTELETDVED